MAQRAPVGRLVVSGHISIPHRWFGWLRTGFVWQFIYNWVFAWLLATLRDGWLRRASAFLPQMQSAGISSNWVSTGQFTFHDDGTLSGFGLSAGIGQSLLRWGAFRTSGWDCNRPYYNERPAGIVLYQALTSDEARREVDLLLAAWSCRKGRSMYIVMCVMGDASLLPDAGRVAAVGYRWSTYSSLLVSRRLAGHLQSSTLCVRARTKVMKKTTIRFCRGSDEDSIKHACMLLTYYRRFLCPTGVYKLALGFYQGITDKNAW